jgi:hypothetical protein
LRTPAPDAAAPPAAAAAAATDEKLFELLPAGERPQVAFVPRSNIPRLTRQLALHRLVGQYLALLLEHKRAAPQQAQQVAGGGGCVRRVRCACLGPCQRRLALPPSGACSLRLCVESGVRGPPGRAGSRPAA